MGVPLAVGRLRLKRPGRRLVKPGAGLPQQPPSPASRIGVRMSLAVAIQMDPLETVNIDGDSSFALALEAQRRGHGLYHYLPRQLSYRHGPDRRHGPAVRGPPRARQPCHASASAGDHRSGDPGRGADAPGPAVQPRLHLGHPPARPDPPADAGGQRPAPCPQRAREAVRHPVRRADAADPDHLRSGGDQGVPARVSAT